MLEERQGPAAEPRGSWLCRGQRGINQGGAASGKYTGVAPEPRCHHIYRAGDRKGQKWPGVEMAGVQKPTRKGVSLQATLGFTGHKLKVCPRPVPARPPSSRTGPAKTATTPVAPPDRRGAGGGLANVGAPTSEVPSERCTC